MLNKIDCICSYYTDNIYEMNVITSHTKQKYCKLHDVIFVNERLENYDKHPAWYKIELLKNLLQQYNTIMYIDADAGFVNYDDINELLDFSSDVNICKTIEGLNTGVFIVKSTDKMLSALDLAMQYYDEYETSVLNEQDALVRAMIESNLTMNVVSDEYLNATPCNRTDKTKILHIMGDMKNYLSVNALMTIFTY